MAAVATLVQSTLKMCMKVGIDKHGKDVIKDKKIAFVKVDAKNDDVLAVAKAMSALKLYPVIGIDRLDENTLSEA